MALEHGQFRIREVGHLGSGGLGTVDQVEVVETSGSHPIGTMLARKRLGPKWSADPGARERFEREIGILRSMNHPNIVSLEGVSLPGAERWYAMPYFPQGNLRAALTNGRRFVTPYAVAGFGAVIADALEYAHGMNFIHRDLKPENILLGANDEPVISDWGLGQFIHKESRVLDLTLGGPLGTGYYCSFEQWTTGRCEISGDVYSLGVVLAELAARTPVSIMPIGAGILQDTVPANGVASRAFNNAIRKMTSFVPSARHQTMGEVASALRVVTAIAAS